MTIGNSNLFRLHRPDEFRGGDVQNHYDSFRNDLELSGYHYLGRGGTRLVYERNNHVIKVPRRGDGIIDNYVEHMLWHKYRDNPTSRNLRVAPCRLLPNACLLMVRVERVDEDDLIGNYPWIANMADLFQGGFYKNKLVVYDFALEAVEREEWEEQWGVSSDILHCAGWQSGKRKVESKEVIPFEEL